MKKPSLVRSRLLLLLPFLVVGCATRSLTVPITTPPEYLIRDHKGVMVFPTESKLSHAKANDLAQQLTSAMEEALSGDGNSFHLVAGSERDKLNKHLNELGTGYDNINPDALESLERAFGNEIPATAWFSGKMVLVESTEQVGESINAFTNEPYAHRSGRVDVRWQVSFLDIGTGKRKPKTLASTAAAAQTTSAVGTQPPQLDYNSPFQRCVSDLTVQFQRLWTVSTQNVEIEVFVGDGEFNMPWEGSEYPLLASGYLRLETEQYPLAQADYQKLVDQLQSGGGEMLGRALYNLALSYELTNDYETARGHYDKAVGAAPNGIFVQGLNRCKKRIADRLLLEEAESLRIQP